MGDNVSKRVVGISNNGYIVEEVDNKKLYGISPWSLGTQYFEGDKITFNESYITTKSKRSL